MSKTIIIILIICVILLLVWILKKKKETYSKRTVKQNIDYFNMISSLPKTSFENQPDINLFITIFDLIKETLVGSVQDLHFSIDIPVEEISGICQTGNIHLEGDVNNISTNICLLKEGSSFGEVEITLQKIRNAFTSNDINITQFQLTGRQDFYSTDKGTLWALLSFKTGSNVTLRAHAYGEIPMPDGIPNVPLGSITEYVDISLRLQCAAVMAIDIEKNSEFTKIIDVRIQPLQIGNLYYSISNDAISVYDGVVDFINNFGASIPSIEDIARPFMVELAGKFSEILYDKISGVLIDQLKNTNLDYIYWDIFGQWLSSCTRMPNSKSLNDPYDRPNLQYGPNVWNFYDNQYVYYCVYNLAFTDTYEQNPCISDSNKYSPLEHVPPWVVCNADGWFTFNNGKFLTKTPVDLPENNLLFVPNSYSFWRVPREPNSQSICESIKPKITRSTFSLVTYTKDGVQSILSTFDYLGPYLFMISLSTSYKLNYDYYPDLGYGTFNYDDVLFFKNIGNNRVEYTLKRDEADKYLIINDKDILDLKSNMYLINVPEPQSYPIGGLGILGYSSSPTNSWSFTI